MCLAFCINAYTIPECRWFQHSSGLQGSELTAYDLDQRQWFCPVILDQVGMHPLPLFTDRPWTLPYATTQFLPPVLSDSAFVPPLSCSQGVFSDDR